MRHPFLALTAFFVFTSALSGCAPVTDGPYGAQHVPPASAYEKAKAGDAAALEETGMAYCNAGDKTAKADAAKALGALKRAAARGRAGSALFLSQMYDQRGTCGLTPDNRQMLHWNKEAARLGSGYAAKQLAMIYSAGYGHPNDGFEDHAHQMKADAAEAYFWYKVAAANDYWHFTDVNARVKAEQDYLQRQANNDRHSLATDAANAKHSAQADLAAAKAKLTPAQIAALDEKAQAWLKKYPQHAF